MHTYIVGQLYDPSRKSWPEGADYNFRAGGHTLRVFLGHATPREIAAIKTGRVEFGAMIELPEIFVVSRFHGPDGRVVASFDCSYQWHRVSSAERTDPPAWEETSPQLRALLSIILVEQNSRVALTFSTRTVILDKGRIVYDGASEPLRTDPDRLAKLIGIVE